MDDVPVLGEDGTILPPKRGRGRPKGVNKDLLRLLHSANPDDPDKALWGDQKRGRGRPKGSKTVKKEKVVVEIRKSIRLPERVEEPKKVKEPTRKSLIEREVKSYAEPEVEEEPEEEISPLNPLNSRQWYETWLKEVEERAQESDQGQGRVLRSMADKLLNLAAKKEAARRRQQREDRARERRVARGEE